jgi:NAD(P)H-flavin reductase/ferredoxin
MRKACRVHVNDERFTANRGEVLLDAALSSGVEIPHDCRAGHCGTCKVKVLGGMTVGGECEEPGMIKACQARLITDLDVMVEPVPEVLTTRATLLSITPRAPDVMELRIRPHSPISYLPGQYYRFKFRGFPARYFSPTAPMDRPFDGEVVHLHVRRMAGGRVSSALGREIQAGHPLLMNGPYGSAWLRPGQQNRLVLIGSGTGFAPIWSIAEAALAENPHREIVLMAAAKTISSLYMAPAFRRLRNHRNIQLIPMVSEKPASVARIVRKGRPTDHMPRLYPDDIVYACGAPQMVDAVKDIVLEAGATFYADPFTPQHGSHDDDGIVSRAMAWLNALVPMSGRARGEDIRMLPKPEAAPPQPPVYSPPPAAFRPPASERPPHRPEPRAEQPSALRRNRGSTGAPPPFWPPASGHYGNARAD